MNGFKVLVIVYLALGASTCIWAEETTYQATTATDLEITTGDLDLLLRPLRRGQLVVELEAWMDLLEAKVTEVSLAEVGMRAKGREITEKKEDVEKQIADAKQKREAVASVNEPQKPAEASEPAIQQKLQEIGEKTEQIAEEAENLAEKVAVNANEDEDSMRPSENEVLEKAAEVKVAKEKLKLTAAQLDNSELELEEKVKKLGEAELELHTKIKAQLLANINRLQEEQTALIDRVRVAIAALKAKGGEVEEYEQYVAAISGLNVDINDIGAAEAIIIGWLKSPQGGLRWAQNILAFIVIVIAAKILSVLLGRLTRRAVNLNKKYSDLLRNFLVNIVRKTVFVVGLVVALSMLGINIGPLVASIGAIGFIVGFALQGTLGNFAAGLMILTHRPYDVGDIVTTAGITGFVESMNLNTTTIKTFDNQIVVVPNGSIWGDNIINVTGSDTRRVDLVFGIGYADDIAKAQAILENILASHPLVLENPEPNVKVHELGDSSVNFICRPWSKTSDYWPVYWDVTRTVKEQFDAEGITIPFPQRDVHFFQEVPPTTAVAQSSKNTSQARKEIKAVSPPGKKHKSEVVDA